MQNKNFMTEKINDAEVEAVKEESYDEIPKAQKKNSRRDFYVELALFLILGILIGVAVKTEASKRITMGFNDYKINAAGEYYSINKLQADLIKKKTEALSDNANDPSAIPEGATCE